MSAPQSLQSRGPAALTATAIATGVRTGALTALAVLEEFLDRLERQNPTLNAVVAARGDAARAEAREIDRRVASGEPVGPLAGVPFTVKDVLATEDLPTTCGSRTMAGHRTRRDATVVARLRAADAVLVGKTNCPEFAFGVDTVNSLHGPTRNPLGDFTAGGSSGGEAAAVAAGMSALGVGTDFGGSVRWPAQCTALVGLRPTVGRLPRTGVLPTLDDDEPLVPNQRSMQGRLEVPGLLARRVDDIEAALRVATGPDPFDACTVPVALGDSSDVTLSRIELRWAGGLAGVGVTSEIADAVAAAADILAHAGATVTDGVPSAVDEAPELYAALRATDPLDEIRQRADGRGHLLDLVVSRLLVRPPDSPRPDVVRLWARRDRLAADLAGWLRGDRLLALPVSTCPPLRTDVSSGTDHLVGRFDVVTPCRAVSLFGLPAMSVPCGVMPDGRPLSVQLVAPAFREDLLFAAGREIERRSGARS